MKNRAEKAFLTAMAGVFFLGILSGSAFAAEKEIVYFGSYEQDLDFENGPEPIAWKVCSSGDGEVLIVSEKILDILPFHTDFIPVTWSRSYVCEWMGDNFRQKAFSEEESKAILPTHIPGGDGGEASYNTIFLLSKSEACTVLEPDEMMAEITPYACSKGGWEISEEELNSYPALSESVLHNGWWWIRPGNEESNLIGCIGPDGTVLEEGFPTICSGIGIRPAMYVEASALTMVQEDGEEEEDDFWTY